MVGCFSSVQTMYVALFHYSQLNFPLSPSREATSLECCSSVDPNDLPRMFPRAAEYSPKWLFFGSPSTEYDFFIFIQRKFYFSMLARDPARPLISMMADLGGDCRQREIRLALSREQQHRLVSSGLLVGAKNLHQT